MTEERIEQIRDHLEDHNLHYLADECSELLAEVERLRDLRLSTAPPEYREQSVLEAVEELLDIDNTDIVARVNPSQFAALKSEVNSILKAIVANPPQDRYCVNYADLRCVGVSRVIEEDGGLWWLVEMEEGDDHEFCQLVRSQLSDKWGSVIVRMEW